MIKQVVESNNLEGYDESHDKVMKGFLNRDATLCITHMDAHNSFVRLARYVVNTYHPKRVLELGSGAGDLSHFVRVLDPEVTYVSVDINKTARHSPWYQGENSYHFVSRTDEPLLFVGDKNETVFFDVILSFEHFEHIAPEKFRVFLDNMVRHMTKDTIVLASTAEPQVTCEGVHINLKNSEEWNKYLISQGFQMLDPGFLNTDTQPFNTAVHLGLSKGLAFKLA